MIDNPPSYQERRDEKQNKIVRYRKREGERGQGLRGKLETWASDWKFTHSSGLRSPTDEESVSHHKHLYPA